MNASLKLAVHWGLYQIASGPVLKNVKTACQAFKNFAQHHNVRQDSTLAQSLRNKTSATDFANGIQLASLLKRPEISADDCFDFSAGQQENGKLTGFEHNEQHYQFGFNFARTWLDHCVIELIYAGYIERAALDMQKTQQQTDQSIPDEFDFSQITALSNEAREILVEHRPQSINQASKLPGITPVAVDILTLFVHRHQQQEQSQDSA